MRATSPRLRIAIDRPIAAALTFGVLLPFAFLGVARADGGTVRVRESAGPFLIAVFSSPEPLRVGRADLSVLVQQRDGGAAVLDATVSLRLEAPDRGDSLALPATRAQATNKLLYAASVDLPSPGTWRLEVDVQQGGASATVGCALPVEARSAGLAAVWALVLLPAGAVALFALQQWIARNQTRGSRTERPG